MTTLWTPLTQELALWRDAGLTLPIWWRDDDAVAATPALDHLDRISRQTGLPVHLAIIPDRAQTDLADAVLASPALLPVVHGWAHISRAPEGEKKAEFGAHRPLGTMRAEAQRGLARLETLFGDRLRRMFVPPWNRVAPDLGPHLAASGYRSLSTYLPRQTAQATPGLARINTHLDPIDWRGARGLIAPETLVAWLVTLLQDRRFGVTDAAEPLGLLTHHLVHDAAIWHFTEALIDVLLDGPTEPWTHPPQREDLLP